MKKPLLFAGLDVHAENITAAIAEGGGGEARLYGTIANDLHALEKVAAKLKKAGGTASGNNLSVPRALIEHFGGGHLLEERPP